MRAVEFNVTIPGYLLARSLGRLSDAFVYGRASRLGLVDRTPPPLPGEDWVRIEVLLCGICGSDLGNVSYRSSPAMEPFGSFPAVLGHEILGRVVEVGSGVTHVGVGDRVVVDPMLHCEARGWGVDSWCRSCAGGTHATCELAGERGPAPTTPAAQGSGGLWDGGLSPGSTIGYHRDLPGGWGEEMVAHRRQVFAVPDGVPDRVAVLAEPLSIGVHGVLQSGALQARGPVLVIGSGAIAFGTIWALRTLGHAGRVVAQMKRPHEAALAGALGADEVVAPGEEAREALIGTGAHAYMPVVGAEVYAGGGFDVVFDCVGSQSSVAQAIGYASARGRVVLLGCAGQLRKLDLTFVWAHELRIQGHLGYGAEEWDGRRLHTFAITLERMAADPRALGDLVTHVFPLKQYRDALRAADDHRRSGALKVALRPRGD
ncbi:MAG: zinc-binding dehydrogenase [Gemmatimonadetes bacterium]|nr:zinc-binding dehydrogenase [Gemmatimonadota bacterium]